MDKNKTILINDNDRDKTVLIDKDKTILIKKNGNQNDKDKTVLLEKSKESVSKNQNLNNLIGDAFKGLNVNGYIISGLLSDTGGESYIFLANKENDDKTYIVKIYKQEYNLDEDTVNKLSKIDSPYVMKILDSGVIKGKHYEITPYYEKGTLQENINNLTLEFIKNTIIYELNEGLKAVHDSGLVHNDIKPHNIFLSNDGKHIVIGDFGIVNDLNGRDYATKYVGGLSEIFSAPEAYRYTSFKVDYYSLGMTIYHLAYKGDPFKDMSNDRVRGMIANDNIVIDSSLDSDIADLIYMLIKNSPKERLDYNGVNDWIKNNSMYHSYRKSGEIAGEGDFKISHEFNGTVYTSMHKLINAMYENYDLGYKHYVNGYIQDDVDNALGKQELGLELKDIRKEYKDNLELAYFMTLRKIQPKSEFNYKGIKYKDFKEYLEYCFSDYPNSLNEVFELRLLLSLLGNKDEKIKDIITKIFSYKIKREHKYSLFLSYFSENEKIYYDGIVYESLQDFSNILFKGMQVSELSWDKQNALWDFLVYKYNFESCDNVSNDLFKAHCQISKMINGYVKLIYENDMNIVEIKNSKDILDILNQKIEYEKKIFLDQEIINFVTNGNFITYYSCEEQIDEGFITLLKEVKNETDINIIAKLYLYTNKVKKYFIRGKEFKEIKEIVKYLETVNDLETISTEILSDEYFKVWLKAKGYQIQGEGFECLD